MKLARIRMDFITSVMEAETNFIYFRSLAKVFADMGRIHPQFSMVLHLCAGIGTLSIYLMCKESVLCGLGMALPETIRKGMVRGCRTCAFLQSACISAQTILEKTLDYLNPECASGEIKDNQQDILRLDKTSAPEILHYLSALPPDL